MVTRREWRVLPNLYSACRVLHEQRTKGCDAEEAMGLDSGDSVQNASAKIQDLNIKITANDMSFTALEAMRQDIDKLTEELRDYQVKVEGNLSIPEQTAGIVLPSGAKLVYNSDGVIRYEVQTIGETVTYEEDYPDVDSNGTPYQVVDEEYRQQLIREKLIELEKARKDAENFSQKLTTVEEHLTKKSVEELAQQQISNYGQQFFWFDNTRYKSYRVEVSTDKRIKIRAWRVDGVEELLCAQCYQILCEKCYHCHTCEVSEIQKKFMH